MVLGQLLGACDSDAARDDPSQPGVRIVVITLDTVRFDALAASMPTLQSLTQRGLVYERFYSAAPTTQPAHASLFTGLHPWQHGVVRNGLVLDESFTTLAERFQSAGWDTSAVVASFPVHAKFGFAQGFDVYDDDFTYARKRMPETWIGLETTGEHFYSIAYSITDKALAALDRMQAMHQFLWVHYFDAHSPYGDLSEDKITLHRLRVTRRDAPADYDARLERARQLYAVDARRLDVQLARLIERLMDPGAPFETHILITADHGESFGEDGALGHDSRLTPEQIHIPFLLLSPRVTPGVSQAPAGTVDAHATLAALGELAPLTSAQETSQGRDLSTGSNPTDAQAFGMRHFDARQGTPRFYAVSAGQPIVAGDAQSLYENDLSQRALPHGERGALRARFETFAQQLERCMAESLDDDETRRTLGAMGYVGDE